jgi:hypothetical protein
MFPNKKILIIKLKICFCFNFASAIFNFTTPHPRQRSTRELPCSGLQIRYFSSVGMKMEGKLPRGHFRAEIGKKSSVPTNSLKPSIILDYIYI